MCLDVQVEDSGVIVCTAGGSLSTRKASRVLAVCGLYCWSDSSASY